MQNPRLVPQLPPDCCDSNNPMNEASTTPETLTQQVAEDVRRAKELNKALSEVVTKLANKL
jgi:hypothetical protein